MRVLRSIAATSTAVLALGGAVLAAPAAQADTTAAAAATTTATVERYDGAIWYRAAAGQVNDLQISTKVIDVDPNEFGGDYLVTFRDKFEIAITTDACTYPSATDHTVVECVEPEPLGSDDSDIYDVELGDGNDTVTVGDDVYTQGTLYGGPGDDVILGKGANNLNGGDGDDRLEGVDGVWVRGSSGEAGNDTILTGCAYHCSGGPGNDILTVTGEDDLGYTTLYGDDGNDIVRGTSGNDYLYGGRGNDTLYGLAGNDTIFGNTGDDIIYGGQGNDTLSGGAGNNKVYQD
ncbi:calcium-binding protein [Streptomyces sp. NPDC058694]|uniref:calcium-binding protein n=1 Tax=Streptomyces sp. NPDC058694 TaxID=3346603 RepID=UPI00365F0586